MLSPFPDISKLAVPKGLRLQRLPLMVGVTGFPFGKGEI